MEKNILIVNVNWVGDVLFSTPFIRAVRQAYPKSFIACLVHPRCQSMMEGNPGIDEIIVYDEEGLHKGIFGKARLIGYLKSKHFDKAFILHRSFTKTLITYLAAIKERIGYSTKSRGFLLTKPIREPEGDIHKVDYFLNIAKSAGIAATDKSYEYYIKEPDRLLIRDFLASNGIADNDRLVVICPGGNWDPKRWPWRKFAQISDLLIEDFNARVVIAGAEKDVALAEEIKKAMRNVPVIACGKTTLKELGAILERAELVIANDTGPMHMAVAMKTRVIALFGPTSPAITGPYGQGNYRVISRHEDCAIPCYDTSCKVNRCMDAIKVEDVIREVEKLLP